MTADDSANTTASDAWQIQAARYALLSEVVLLIAKTTDLDRLLAGAVNKIKWVIDFERCTLALLHKGEDTYGLQTLLETRRDVATVTEESVPTSQGLAGEVMEGRRMRLIRDLATSDEAPLSVVDPAMEDGSLVSVLSLPLQAYGRMIGCITFGAAKDDAFNQEDVKVAVAFSTHLALAIDRWQQTEELQQANESLRLEVAERMRAEKESQTAKEAAEEATRAKSDFLAKMSHELRTPLNAIIGYSEMLSEEMVEVGQPEFVPDLEKIRSAGKHLLGLINDILDLSKIEAGKMDVFVEDFGVADMINDVQTVISPLASQNDITLRTDCPDGIGMMQSDQTKVRQNLFNLLSNACKFSQGGDVTLTVKRIKKDSTDFLEFSVADTGIGMSPDQLKKVFDAFTQADASTTRRFGGTGLGLAITQHFCRMLGGDIAVESIEGKGTIFTISLPAFLESPVEEIASNRPATVQPDDASGTILVIDDDAAAHEKLDTILTVGGYHVVHAYSGEEGLRMARDIHPDLITLDIIMPSKDGWDVLKELMATPEVSEIPVIMVTIMGDKDMGYALGASDFLTKPVEPAALLKVVNRHRYGEGKTEVLIVDDDQATRVMLRRVMEKQGWSVVEAVDGQDALEKLQELQPKLILLDLMMPKIDGFQVMTEMAANEKLQKIPVVVITAKDVSREEAKQLQGHVEAVFKKGVYHHKDLLQVVRNRIAEQTD